MNPVVGLLSFPPEEGQLNKPYSDDTARIIDTEVRSLVDYAYKRTLKVGCMGGEVRAGTGRCLQVTCRQHSCRCLHLVCGLGVAAAFVLYLQWLHTLALCPLRAPVPQHMLLPSH